MAEEFRNYLDHIAEGNNLNEKQAQDALFQIVRGEVNEAQTAAFLFGMRQKGETIDELSSFVKVMRKAAVKVDVNADGAVDLCGTGGDHSGTFNISTAAMFVVAGAGIPVLKHGNRSISSQCGSADVLEELGVKPDLDAVSVAECYNQTGMAFMFAPLFHPAMKYVMPARRNLGIRTFFNILGPMLNPAEVKRQVVGAFNLETASIVIQILSKLDTKRAFTVNSDDGLDEFSTTALSNVFELKNNVHGEAIRFDGRNYGIKRVSLDDLKGGNREKNAKIIEAVISGKASEAQTDIVVLNAAFGVLASGKAGIFEDALEMASESIQNGSAHKKLNQFKTCTQDVAAS